MESASTIHQLQEEIIEKYGDYHRLLIAEQWLELSDYLIGKLLEWKFKSKLITSLLEIMKSRCTPAILRANIEAMIPNYEISDGYMETVHQLENMITVIETLTFTIVERGLLIKDFVAH